MAPDAHDGTDVLDSNETAVETATAVEAALDAVTHLGPGWAKRSAAADTDGSIAPETAAEIRQAGLHRLLQPRTHGGAQASVEAHMRVVSAVGRHCMAASWCTAVWSAHNWMIGLFEPKAQAEVWAEPDVLVSASIVPKISFPADDRGVTIQGVFPFASGCDHTPWLAVGGLVDYGPGVNGGGPARAICLLPAEVANIDHDSWDVTGLRGTGSKDLVIETPVRVPWQRVLNVGQADRRQAPGQQGDDRLLYRVPFRPTATIVLAAPPLGAAQAAVDRFRDRLDGRTMMYQGGGSQRHDPAAGLRLAESAAEVDAAELVLLNAARRTDELAASPPDPMADATILRDIAYAVRLCASAVDRLYEASGGTSLHTHEPMQRYWRDVHAARLHAILTWDAAAAGWANASLAT